MNKKRYLLVLLLCSFCQSACLAGVFGIDNFNDGFRDGTKWSLPDFSNLGGQFLETNSRLTFNSLSGGARASCTWLAPMPAGSNWMVSCDVAIVGPPATSRSWWKLWITRVAPFEPDRVWFALQQWEGATYDFRGVINAVDAVTNTAPASLLQSTLRLKYLGRDNIISAEFKEPGTTNFIALPNFGLASWDIGGSTTFAIKLEAYSDVPVLLGQMTADNFEVAPFVGVPVTAPEIVSPPTSRTVAVGSAVDLRASVSGFPSSYQWLQDGTPVPGGTNSSLRLTNVRTNQSGVYSVIASNSFGQVASQPALLTVLPPLRATRYSVQEGLEQGSLNPIQSWLESSGIPVDITPHLSLPITNKVLLLPCLIADLPVWPGHPDATNVQDFVRRGGLLIAMGGTATFLNRVFGFSLAIAEDRGVYSRTEQSFATPFLYGRQHLSNLNHNPYEQRPPCAMGIVSSSLPIGAREIYRDEADLSFLTIIPYGDGNIVVMDWDSYGVYPLMPADDGWYETFDLALALRAGVSPIAPRITRDLEDQSPLEASDLTLTVGVAGTGPIAARWFKNGDLIAGASTSPLTLHSVSSKDSGDYRVVITNSAGAVTSRVAKVEVRATKGRVGMLANSYSTNLARSIESAGFTPLIITSMADYDLTRLDLLMIDNWNSFSFPDVEARSAEIREWTANGGKLILHGSASFLAEPLQFAPGCDEMTFISSPDNLIVDGPYGSLPRDLPPGRWHYYSTVALPSVPTRALPVFGIGCGPNLLAFSYGLGLGSVYYCSIDFPSFVSWEETGVYANLYVPNLLAHAMHFTSSGAPILLNQKTNASILPLRSVQFFAAVNGGGPLSYQWYHDGAAIEGATNAAFRIENATTNDSGQYSVSASNPFGTITEELGSVAVVDPIPFRLLALLESNPQTVSDNLSGSPYGGIAVSTDQVFYSGSTGAVRFPAFPLGPGTSAARYYGVVSDLRTEKVYTLGGSNGPATSSTDVITSLLELDQNGGLTLDRVDFSKPLRLDGFNGLFAANGAVVLAFRENVYRIDLPSGQVTGLGAVPSLAPNQCFNSVSSGIAEAFSNSVYLVYVAEPGRIVRTDVTSGITTTLASFADGRDICSFTVSPRLGRWFFHGSGSSAGLGSAMALFDSPPRVLTALTNRVIKEDTMAGPITFNVQDLDTPPNKLLVSAQSSNPDLLPPSGLISGGTNFVRTLALKPAANQFGTSVVTIVVTDALGQTTNVNFTLTVTPVNDPPSFSPGSDITVFEDSGPLSFPHWAANISPGPAESDQMVRFVITNDNASLFTAGPAISPDGTLTFTPAANANGIAVVSVVLRDNGGTADGGSDSSGQKVFRISIRPVNDAPIALGENYTIAEDTTLAVTLKGTDIDGDALAFKVQSLPKHGELMGTGSALTYRPDTNFFGLDFFTFSASDWALDSAEARIEITVTPVNDAPVAVISFSPAVRLLPDSLRSVVISRNSSNAPVTLDGRGSYDVDGDPLQFTWSDRDRNVILATIPLVTNSFDVGVSAIRLEVNDGQATGFADEIIEVIRADQAVRLVADFVAKAGLADNRKSQLVEILGEAAASFTEGDRTGGIHSLQAFQKKVQMFVAPPLAEILTNAARLIISSQSPVPRLVRCGHGDGDNLRFTFECESGWKYMLQSSSDLMDWVVEREVVEANGLIELSVPISSPVLFYRVVPR